MAGQPMIMLWVVWPPIATVHKSKGRKQPKFKPLILCMSSAYRHDSGCQAAASLSPWQVAIPSTSEAVQDSCFPVTHLRHSAQAPIATAICCPLYVPSSLSLAAQSHVALCLVPQAQTLILMLPHTYCRTSIESLLQRSLMHCSSRCNILATSSKLVRQLLSQAFRRKEYAAWLLNLEPGSSH